ncbi:uncharacterized protein LOC133736709 [Rosa rugosa]|uniref:uncharacterized protein LOC133736709 n=1 Tax=Rosa rugosa TaxID=74645 RepID=UPI002B403C3D|nr:uncharacterized protein LOC133736709 [Rosa rugosa]
METRSEQDSFNEILLFFPIMSSSFNLDPDRVLLFSASLFQSSQPPLPSKLKTPSSHRSISPVSSKPDSVAPPPHAPNPKHSRTFFNLLSYLIVYAHAYTYEYQYNMLFGLAAKMAKEPLRLLVMDSVISLFRVDVTGRGELGDRQQKLAHMLSLLIKIAEEFNVAVYMTNYV